MKGNTAFLVNLKAARESNKPPTLFLPVTGCLGRGTIEYDGPDDTEGHYAQIPQDEYTPFDVQLSVGYQYFIDSICQKCGTPLWYGSSEFEGIEFDVVHSVCYSCAELDRERESKSYKPAPGETSSTHMHGTRYADGTEDPLPTPLEAFERVS